MKLMQQITKIITPCVYLFSHRPMFQGRVALLPIKASNSVEKQHFCVYTSRHTQCFQHFGVYVSRLSPALCGENPGRE